MKVLGKKPLNLLDYTDRHYDEVLSLLEDKGFKESKSLKYMMMLKLEPFWSKTIRKVDEVIPDETVLEFTVSKGPALIEVKDLREYTVRAVEDYVKSTGLKVDLSQEEYNNDVPKGLVIRQTPEPGAKVEKGSKITVIISNGPEQIPPKKVTREITIPYEPEIEGEQQEVRIYIQDMNRGMGTPFDTFSITETETRILELDILPKLPGDT